MSENRKPIEMNMTDGLEEIEEQKLSEVTIAFYNSYKNIINKVTTVILLGVISLIGYDFYEKKQVEAVNEKVGEFYSAFYSDNADMYTIGEDIASSLTGVKGTGSVLFLLANKYEDDNKIAEASALYNTIVKNYDKKMDIVSFSYSKLAFILESTDLKKSAEIFTDLVGSYPESPLVNVWKLELARINKEDAKNSIALCKEIIDTERVNVTVRQQAKNLLAELEYVN